MPQSARKGPLSLHILKQMVEQFQATPESVDTTHAPGAEMSKRRRAPPVNLFTPGPKVTMDLTSEFDAAVSPSRRKGSRKTGGEESSSATYVCTLANKKANNKQLARYFRQR